jgi:hypothetical protein
MLFPRDTPRRGSPRFIPLAVFLASLTLPLSQPAAAAPLVIDGILSIEFGGALPNVVSTGTDLGTAGGGVVQLTAGGLAGGSGIQPGTFPMSASTNAMWVISGEIESLSNGAGSFAVGGGPGGGFGGLMSLDAFVRRLRFGFVPLPSIFGTFTAPLSRIGAGGTSASAGSILQIPVTVRVAGTGWTTGAVVASGSASTRAGTGFDGRTVGGLGTLQMVTPFTVEVRSASPFGNYGVGLFPGVATLTLSFVPEPAAGWMLTTALVLVLWGRRRRGNAWG